MGFGKLGGSGFGSSLAAKCGSSLLSGFHACPAPTSGMGEATVPAGLRCPICGRPVPLHTGGKGRPRTYDTPECGEIASLLGRLETLVAGHVAIRRDDVGLEEKRAATALRGQFFRLSNVMNYIGRPVAADRPLRDKTRSGWRGLVRLQSTPDLASDNDDGGDTDDNRQE